MRPVDISAAEAAFGAPGEGWLDLSTGINPFAYPAPAIAETSLTRAPSKADLDALIEAARAAYRWPETAAVAAGPGAQAMIQLLPYLRYRRSVAVLGPTYSDHAYLWARAGHEVRLVGSLADVGEAEVVVIVNPNTPTGREIAPDVLLELGARLTRRDGLLVVDETYADVTPELALGARLPEKGTVVLRSFGAFFGLPGLRLGFAAGDAEMASELAAELGPWPVSGPAIQVGRAALGDEGWIASMRLRLSVEAMKLDETLQAHGLSVVGGADLFRTARSPRAAEIHEGLARAGILTLKLDDPEGCLRFRLPGDEAALDRLGRALAKVG